MLFRLTVSWEQLLTHDPTHRIGFTCGMLFWTWHWTSKRTCSLQHRKRRPLTIQSTYGRNCFSHAWPSTSYMYKVPQTVCPHWGVLTVSSPNSVSTLSGSYGKCKGRCLIRVLTLGDGIFPVNFRVEWLLWNLDMRFDRAGSRKVCVCVLGSFWSAAFYLSISV